MSATPSGEQVALRHGPWSATVVEVGGGLRELAHDGAPVLDGYPAGEMASGGRGQALLPGPTGSRAAATASATARSRPRSASPRAAPPSGPATTLWMDGLFGYVMIFTGDTLAPDRRRRDSPSSR